MQCKHTWLLEHTSPALILTLASAKQVQLEQKLTHPQPVSSPLIAPCIPQEPPKAPRAFPQPLPALAGRVSNQNIILKLAAQKPQQQQQQQEQPVARDGASSSGAVTVQPQQQQGDEQSASQPASRSLEYMRGFHSTPASARRCVAQALAPSQGYTDFAGSAGTADKHWLRQLIHLRATAAYNV